MNGPPRPVHFVFSVLLGLPAEHDDKGPRRGNGNAIHVSLLPLPRGGGSCILAAGGVSHPGQQMGPSNVPGKAQTNNDRIGTILVGMKERDRTSAFDVHSLSCCCRRDLLFTRRSRDNLLLSPSPYSLSPFVAQEIRNQSLVRVKSAHPHRIATYDEFGEQTTGGTVVLILVEYCAGGSLQQHLQLLTTQSGGGRGGNELSDTWGSISRGGRKTRGACAAGVRGSGEAVPTTGGLARRLEVWVRQVNAEFCHITTIDNEIVTAKRYVFDVAVHRMNKAQAHSA